MSEPIREMTAAERVALVEREKRRITYRNVTLSVAGVRNGVTTCPEALVI